MGEKKKKVRFPQSRTLHANYLRSPKSANTALYLEISFL